jgi:hypothetical protein
MRYNRKSEQMTLDQYMLHIQCVDPFDGVILFPEDEEPINKALKGYNINVHHSIIDTFEQLISRQRNNVISKLTKSGDIQFVSDLYKQELNNWLSVT